MGCNYIYVNCVIYNENNANNTAVMRMLGQLNTQSLCFDKWAKLIKSLTLTHLSSQ